MSKPTAVYRLFAADDRLLYIGVADVFGVRWHAHARTQPWWLEVHHQTVYWHPTRDDALEAETAAIKAEKPLYNIVHNGAVRTWTPRHRTAGLPHPPQPERSRQIAVARDEMDAAYRELILAIREDTTAGVVSVTEAARQAGWSSEYIRQIRAGTAGETPPKHRRLVSS